MDLQALVRRRFRQHLEALPARPTQAALAEAAGINQSGLSHYLAGRHEFDLNTIGRLAAALQLDLGSLVRADGEIKTTLAPPLAELVALYGALPADSQFTIISLLRELTRPTTQKRARPKKH